MKKWIVASLVCLVIIPLLSMSSFAEDSSNSDTDQTNVVQDNTFIRGIHPRRDGLWLQYYPLETALRGNYIFSDIIEPDSQFYNFRSEPIIRHNLQNSNAENYDDTHNHYQNILSEVINFAEGTNAVAIWGDSAAAVSGSKVWGGFLSARSLYSTLQNSEELQKYVPEGVDLTLPAEDFDAQLVGLEIDVLNDGKPGIYPNMSKTGLQVVGFGNPNSMAIEVRSEDTDRDTDERRGLFESGIYFKNSIADYGRLIVTDFSNAKMGLDFRNTTFNEGAIQLKSESLGTGIIYNQGAGGEISSGKRWENSDDSAWLTVRAGEGGFRVLSQDGTKELLAIDNYGGIYLNGDLYYNNKLQKSDPQQASWENGAYLIILAVFILIIMLLVFSMYLKMAKQSKIIKQIMEKQNFNN